MISTLAHSADEPPPVDGLPKIPGYTVSRLLGRGGMGCVYLATDVGLNREVAVKTLLVDDPDLAARFREEVAAVAAVRHPNVLHVYQAGEADGRPYYVMEYVPGGTLGAELDGKPMAPRAAAALLEPIARAVHHCHGLGILHRDLKPGNILLSAEGVTRGPEAETLLDSPSTLKRAQTTFVPKVADFGLAKRLYGDAKLTRTGDVLGTPAYMAPEQASGVVSQLGPGADVYALGAILYEMLTGRPPFQSPDPMQTLMMVLSMEPLPPRRLLPAIPRDLETICLRCLQKSPKRRYASAGELADDLRRYLEGRPIEARPIRAWEKAVKWARRRPAAAGLVGLGFTAVVALVVGFAVIREKNSALRTANDRLERVNDQTADRVRTALDLVDLMLVELSQDLAASPQSVAARRNVLAEAETLCRRIMQTSETEDLRGHHIIAKARFHLADVYRLQGRDAEALAEALGARDGYVALTAEAPDRTDLLQDAVAARNRVGRLLDTSGDPAGAEEAFRAAVVAGTALPPDDPKTFQILGRVRNNLAVLYARTNRPVLAEAEHRELLAARLTALAAAPDDDDRKRDVAATRMNLANTVRAQNNFDAAVAELEAAESVYVSMPRPRPADRDNLGKVRLNLESAAEKHGKPDVQGRAAQAAAETFAGLATDFPLAPEYRFLHAYARVRIAFWHWGQQRDKLALENVVAARVILVNLTKEFPDNVEYREKLAQCRQLLGEK